MRSTLFVFLGIGFLGMLAGCAGRALDASGGDAPLVIDFSLTGGRDGGGDLAGADLTYTGDLAGAVDLAGPVAEGVPCGADLCGVNEICCASSGTGIPSCASTGSMSTGCPFGDGWRCDGPEDCADNRVCVGSGFMPPTGSPSRSRCRPLQSLGSDSRILCHGDADCQPSFICRAHDTTLPGAPAVSACHYWQD